MKTLKIGDIAPDIESFDENGNPVKLSDFKGKKVIVFFYPRANTPGCTAEACNLRDNYKVLQEKGYEILGVSADTEGKQLNFKSKYDFPFRLIADVDKKLIKAFGVWGEKKFMGKTFDGIHRKTFVIDEKGKIERVIDKVKTKDHAAQIMQKG